MRLGIAIIAFDRPQYTRRLLASLEQQTDLEGVAFHFWQDGAVNAYSGRVAGDQNRIEQTRALWAKAELPCKHTHWRIQNVGIGIHQFEALEWMIQRYRQIVILEDDVVLSPFWLRLVRVLYGQMDEWPDVFSFSLGFRRRCGRGQIAANLNRLTTARSHWWAECFTAANWARVRGNFLLYYRLIQEVDYANLPREEILALYEADGWDWPYVTQDAAKEWAVWRADMVRAVAVVNRAIGIGKEGMHFNPAIFKAAGMDGQMPYIFEGDAELKRFELTKEATCESRC